ncbi:MAG: HAMP domain-containing sensor histidine kinase [Pseudomonadales bacterium]
MSKPVNTVAARRYTDSTSFKMAALFTLFLGISAAVLAYFINQFNTSTLIDRVSGRISADWTSFNDWREMAPLQSIPEVIDGLAQHHLNTFFGYENEEGEFTYGAISPEGVRTMPLEDDLLIMMVTSDNIYSTYEFEGEHRFAARFYDLVDGGRILIARDIEDLLLERRKMQQLGLLTIFLMVAAIAIGFYISTYVAGLTNKISQTAHQIMETGDFSQRIPIKGGGDDLSDLAKVLNDMLAKTEELVGSVRQVSDNIALDLRTPLTRLRNRLDDLDERLVDVGDSETSDIVESVMREADHILGTFGALLRIARIESGKKEKEFDRVEMAPLLQDILELYEPVAEEKGLTIKSRIENFATWGDADMLFQVFANLMDNANKFTPEGGVIELICRQEFSRVVVEVADQGCGIADKDKKRVFERFYRGEESRHTAGNGLGLSLVQAVMKLHKASIWIKDNNPGTRFVISLQLIK